MLASEYIALMKAKIDKDGDFKIDLEIDLGKDNRPSNLAQVKRRNIYHHSEETKGFAAKRRITAIAKCEAKLKSLVTQYKEIQNQIINEGSLSLVVNSEKVQIRTTIKREYYITWLRLCKFKPETVREL